ncbi:MAG TPA: OmpW family outer membrane protein [Wenzhouxiangellaceae bacterium]|nr:OmpW family outer membrane protein [Wenzhouxiangellaceae bacterium]
MKTVITRNLLAAAVVSVAAAMPAVAQEAGDWQLRFGVGYVSPDTSKDDLVFQGTVLDTFEVDVDDQLGVVFDLTYFLSPNWGLELLASTPFQHDIDGGGALAPLGTIGDTKHLPPTLSLQYHFAPGQKFRPYVGAGLNYTLFFDDSTNQGLHDGVIATANGALGANFSGGDTHLSIDDSFGAAFQAGLDIDLTEKWFWNLNVRYIMINVDADLKTTTFDPNGNEQLFFSNIDVDIDPFVYSTQIGFRF